MPALSKKRSMMDETEYEKCGDIIVAPKKNLFAMACKYCPNIFSRLQSFMRHIQQEHRDQIQFASNDVMVYAVEELVNRTTCDDSEESGLAEEEEDDFNYDDNELDIAEQKLQKDSPGAGVTNKAKATTLANMSILNALEDCDVSLNFVENLNATIAESNEDKEKSLEKVNANKEKEYDNMDIDEDKDESILDCTLMRRLQKDLELDDYAYNKEQTREKESKQNSPKANSINSETSNEEDDLNVTLTEEQIVKTLNTSSSAKKSDKLKSLLGGLEDLDDVDELLDKFEDSLMEEVGEQQKPTKSSGNKEDKKEEIEDFKVCNKNQSDDNANDEDSFTDDDEMPPLKYEETMTTSKMTVSAFELQLMADLDMDEDDLKDCLDNDEDNTEAEDKAQTKVRSSESESGNAANEDDPKSIASPKSNKITENIKSNKTPKSNKDFADISDNNTECSQSFTPKSNKTPKTCKKTLKNDKQTLNNSNINDSITKSPSTMKEDNIELADNNQHKDESAHKDEKVLTTPKNNKLQKSIKTATKTPKSKREASAYAKESNENESYTPKSIKNSTKTQKSTPESNKKTNKSYQGTPKSRKATQQLNKSPTIENATDNIAVESKKFDEVLSDNETTKNANDNDMAETNKFDEGLSEDKSSTLMYPECIEDPNENDNNKEKTLANEDLKEDKTATNENGNSKEKTLQSLLNKDLDDDEDLDMLINQLENSTCNLETEAEEKTSKETSKTEKAEIVKVANDDKLPNGLEKEADLDDEKEADLDNEKDADLDDEKEADLDNEMAIFNKFIGVDTKNKSDVKETAEMLDQVTEDEKMEIGENEKNEAIEKESESDDVDKITQEEAVAKDSEENEVEIREKEAEKDAANEADNLPEEIVSDETEKKLDHESNVKDNDQNEIPTKENSTEETTAAESLEKADSQNEAKEMENNESNSPETEEDMDDFENMLNEDLAKALEQALGDEDDEMQELSKSNGEENLQQQLQTEKPAEVLNENPAKNLITPEKSMKSKLDDTSPEHVVQTKTPRRRKLTKKALATEEKQPGKFSKTNQRARNKLTKPSLIDGNITTDNDIIAMPLQALNVQTLQPKLTNKSNNLQSKQNQLLQNKLPAKQQSPFKNFSPAKSKDNQENSPLKKQSQQKTPSRQQQQQKTQVSLLKIKQEKITPARCFINTNRGDRTPMKIEDLFLKQSPKTQEKSGDQHQKAITPPKRSPLQAKVNGNQSGLKKSPNIKLTPPPMLKVGATKTNLTPPSANKTSPSTAKQCANKAQTPSPNSQTTGANKEKSSLTTPQKTRNLSVKLLRFTPSQNKNYGLADIAETSPTNLKSPPENKTSPLSSAEKKSVANNFKLPKGITISKVTPTVPTNTYSARLDVTPSRSNYCKQNFTEQSLLQPQPQIDKTIDINQTLIKNMPSTITVTKTETKSLTERLRARQASIDIVTGKSVVPTKTPKPGNLDFKSYAVMRSARKKEVLQRMSHIKKQIFKSIDTEKLAKGKFQKSPLMMKRRRRSNVLIENVEILPPLLNRQAKYLLQKNAAMTTDPSPKTSMVAQKLTSPNGNLGTPSTPKLTSPNGNLGTPSTPKLTSPNGNLGTPLNTTTQKLTSPKGNLGTPLTTTTQKLTSPKGNLGTALNTTQKLTSPNGNLGTPLRTTTQKLTSPKGNLEASLTQKLTSPKYNLGATLIQKLTSPKANSGTPLNTTTQKLPSPKGNLATPLSITSSNERARAKKRPATSPLLEEGPQPAKKAPKSPSQQKNESASRSSPNLESTQLGLSESVVDFLQRDLKSNRINVDNLLNEEMPLDDNTPNESDEDKPATDEKAAKEVAKQKENSQEVELKKSENKISDEENPDVNILNDLLEQMDDEEKSADPNEDNRATQTKEKQKSLESKSLNLVEDYNKQRDLALLEKVGLQVIKLSNIEDDITLEELEALQEKCKTFADICRACPNVWSSKQAETPMTLHFLLSNVNQILNIDLTLSDIKRLVNLIIMWYTNCCANKLIEKKVLTETTNAYLLMFHFIPKTSKRLYYCEFCEEVCNTEHRYYTHRIGHTGARFPYECKVCGEGFMHAPKQKTHEAVCKNKIPDKAICKTTIQIKSNEQKSHEETLDTKMHVETRISPKKTKVITQRVKTIYNCGKCKMSFPTEVEVNAHVSLCSRTQMRQPKMYTPRPKLKPEPYCKNKSEL